jgi:ABC-type transport system involved in multi-copper enzyme maturation permease subunit
MRLLASEVRRLWRPLLFGTAVCLVATGFLLTRSGALLGQATSLKSNTRVVVPHGLVFTSPTAIGRVAAGLMASLPGLFALLVLGGGHVAGEWSGRTLKSVLLQDGSRWRWLGGKIASLWVVGVALEVVLWGALALWTLALRRWWPPLAHVGLLQGFRAALPDVGLSLLVLALFAALATLAAVLTRSMLGTILAGTFVLGGSMALSNIAFTRELPSYWVTGWMRFHAVGTGAPYALWNDKFPPGIPYPSVAIGVLGVVGLLVACVAIAGVSFARSDVLV